MTLIVAGIHGDQAWIVGDTLISGPGIAHRGKEFCPKIEMSADKRAIFAFSGAESGTDIIARLRVEKSISVVASKLEQASNEMNADFIYIYVDDDQKPNILQFAKGVCKSNIITTHIGSNEAFEQFQRIRQGKQYIYMLLKLTRI